MRAAVRLLACLLLLLLLGAAARKLSQASNTDTFLLSNQNGSLQRWNASDQAAARALNASAAGYYVHAGGVVAVGTVRLEGAANPQPSQAACAASCAGFGGCDVFNYCEPAAERCVVSLLGMALLGGYCELRSQSEVRMGRGIYVTSGGGGVSTGAPVTVSAQDIAGYAAFPGISFGARRYNYDCTATWKRGTCMIAGTTQELAAACNADPRCVGFSAFPHGSADLTDAMGYLLGDPTGTVHTLDLGWSALNPASILYVSASSLQPPASPSPSPSLAADQRSAQTDAAPPLLDGEASIEAAPPAAGSQSPAPAVPSSQQHKSLKGLSLAGVIVGAGVAAAALGALAGYIVLRKRTTTPGLAVPVSPAKLRSLYNNDAAVLASVTSAHASLSPLSRRSAAKSQAALQLAARTSSSPGTGQHGQVDRSSTSGAVLEASPSRTVISQLFSKAEAPQWAECVVPSSALTFCTTPDGRKLSLGSGYSGTVYKVMLHGTQVCAAKVVELGHGNERWFMEEAVMLRRLRHTNVVNFMGVAAADGRGILLMEYMAGKDLGSAMGVKGPDGGRLFGWYARGRRVTMDVALGLAYLHQMKVIHFDLKPQNILLTNPGFTAKIGDCGFARIKNKTLISDLGGRIGTFCWCSPEVLLGVPCDEKADIYSFGVVLWEVCSGEAPVRGQMPPLRVPEDCPAEVAALQLRCVSQDPAERPTAKEIVALLNQLASPQRGPSRGRRQGSTGEEGQPAPAGTAVQPLRAAGGAEGQEPVRGTA